MINPCNRRRGMAAPMLALCAALLTTSASADARQSSTQPSTTLPQRPNVLVILADDLGYGDTGAYGAELIRTPNIDRLALQGLRFTDAHAPAAICQPTRYGLLAGRYAWRNPHLFNSSGALVFRPDETTLPRLLQSHGYQTAIIGKWHLGFGMQPPDYNRPLRPGPLDLGFDYFFGPPRSHNEAPFVFVENERIFGFSANDPLQILSNKEARARKLPTWGWGSSVGAKRAHELRPADEIDLRLARRAMQWLRRHGNSGPFFLYLPFVAPHTPQYPSAKFAGQSRIGRYGDVVEELDSHIGDILATLDEEGLTDNTIVIMTSDNGAIYGADHIKSGHKPNGTLLGQKTDTWEGGNRIPLIVRWPGRVPAGTETDALFSLTDIMATVAGAADIDLPDNSATDSINQLPLLLAPQSTDDLRESMVYQGTSGDSSFALRSGRWTWHPYPGSGGMTTHPTISWGQTWSDMGMSTNDRHEDGSLKPGAPPAQLYDVQADPNQIRNRFREFPRLTLGLHEVLTSALAGFLTISPNLPAAPADARPAALLARYDFGDTPSASRLDADLQAAGVLAGDLAEIGDADHRDGLANFSNATLNIKRLALDNDLFNNNNGISFLLSPRSAEHVLGLDELRLQFGPDDKGAYFRLHVQLTTAAGATTAQVIQGKIPRPDDPWLRIGLNARQVWGAARLTIEFGHRQKPTDRRNFSLRINTIEVWGRTHDVVPPDMQQTAPLARATATATQ